MTEQAGSDQECGARRPETVCTLEPGHKFNHLFGRDVRPGELPQGLANAAKMIEDLRREIGDLQGVVERQHGNLKAYGEQIDEQADTIRRFREANSEMSSALKSPAVVRLRQSINEHEAATKELADATLEARQAAAAHRQAIEEMMAPRATESILRSKLRKIVDHWRSQSHLYLSGSTRKVLEDGAADVQRLLNSIAAEEMTWEDGPPANERADRAQMSAAEAYRLVDEAETQWRRADEAELRAEKAEARIREYVSAEESEHDRADALADRLSYVLCVDHRNKTLPRCAVYWVDDMQQRFGKAVSEREDVKAQLDEATAKCEREHAPIMIRLAGDV